MILSLIEGNNVSDAVVLSAVHMILWSVLGNAVQIFVMNHQVQVQIIKNCSTFGLHHENGMHSI